MPFEEELADLAEEYGIPADRVAAVRDSSKLKAERDAANADAAAKAARAEQLENKLAADIFTKLGLPGTPDTYKLPGEVDRTDEAQIAAWATAAGLLKVNEPAEPSPEAAAHQRMDAITSGATPPPPPNVTGNVEQLRRQIMRAGPDQLQPGSELHSRVIDTLQQAGHTFGPVEHGTTFERIPDWGSKTPA